MTDRPDNEPESFRSGFLQHGRNPAHTAQDSAASPDFSRPSEKTASPKEHEDAEALDYRAVRNGLQQYFGNVLHRKGLQPVEDLEVQILDLPDLNVASVRFIGPYNGVGKAVSMLTAWAAERKIMTPESLLFTAMHDNPALTEPERLRSDVCLTVPAGTQGQKPIYIQTLKCAGKYACGYFEFWDPREFPIHWKRVALDWLAQSGCKPDISRPMIEIYRGDPATLDTMFRVDICMPIRSK